MNTFTPLPQAYKDEIQLDEALKNTEIMKSIEFIDLYLTNARNFRKQGETESADFMCAQAEKKFTRFNSTFSLFDHLQGQRDAYDEDLKKRATLTGNITSLDDEIAQYKQKISELLKERKKTSKEIDRLGKKLGLEHLHTRYRKAMVEYAKKNDKQHAERIEKRAGSVEELISKGLIKEDVDGVSFGGLKTASKAVQEKALQDAFGDTLQPNYQREDHQGNKSGTKKVCKKDLDAHGDQFGEWTLGSNDQLNIMRDRIRKNFDDVYDEYDEVYILQLINPDLFEAMWMKDTDGNYRHYLRLGRDVVGRSVNEGDNPDYKCGLFLVR